MNRAAAVADGIGFGFGFGFGIGVGVGSGIRTAARAFGFVGPARRMQAAAPALSIELRAHGAVSSLDNLHAYRVALEACRVAAPLAAALSANLKDQLSRASSSVVLNIAEGFGSSSRGVKRRHYEIARGSPIECIAVLDLVSALGVAPDVESRAARGLFTRAAMMLARLGARFR